jgi:diguanylate cyclase (GGDEF)-like protein/PAS domain S-box-containing protein
MMRLMSRNTAASEHALTQRLMPLVWSLFGLVALVLTLMWGAQQVQLALAGLLNGESTWSKSQKQIVVALQDYVVQGNPESLDSFDSSFAILEADRFAREETAHEHFDWNAAASAFERGKVMPEAIPVMVFIFRYLPGAPYVREALVAWRSTDAAIDELATTAGRLRVERHSPGWTSQRMSMEIARIAALNRIIQPQTELFSTSIAHGTVWIGQILYDSVFVIVALASLIWLRMARRTMVKIRGTEERYRVLFDSAPDAIVMVDENNGIVLDANRTAADWIGGESKDLVGRRFGDLIEHDDSVFAKSAATGRLRPVAGPARSVETQWSTTRWGEKHVQQAIIRDVSERVALEHDRRIAAEALASIAEGVLIADANRCVIAVNAAHTELTGFEARELIGQRIDDLRVLPHGGQMPPEIWEQIAATGSWFGEVRARRRDGSMYDERLSISVIRDAKGQVQRYVAVIADITAAKSDRVQLEHLARHDALTGLANRAQFEEHCSRAILVAEKARRAVAVMFIDLDSFKAVNDSFSHAVGDRLLETAATRIAQQLSPLDVAGRIGGDEFTVLVTGLAQREDATALANRLLATLSEPFVVDDNEIVISASIGIAGYPLDALDATTLIANADTAMYAAKTEERNCARLYTPMMHAMLRSRLQLAAELRQALAHDELHVVYQPTVEMRSGRIVAVEALLRWQHPVRGMIPPSDFIPIAEELGLIRQLDQWVMDVALMQLAEWEKLGMPPIRVALNVSASWFDHQAFVESLIRSLLKTRVPASRLVLEITESSVLRLGEDTDRIMYRLHELGVRVAIDDFGTGYSSLAYLKLPAVNTLKIDRLFVSGLPANANDAAIVQAMLAMSESLGLRTIAEGIETEAQHDFLLRAGCMEAQGFFYSRPIEAAEVEKLLLPNAKHIKTRLQLVSPERS